MGSASNLLVGFEAVPSLHGVLDYLLFASLFSIDGSSVLVLFSNGLSSEFDSLKP